VLSGDRCELQGVAEPTAEAIVRAAADADALLVTYARITAEMIPDGRCRIISRFGMASTT